ncbi:MAG: hypothetical protein IJ697_04670 [Synergistaceae bacterium]|nr:hypothetical protein [Synergistaceae bacterium]
MEILMTNSGVRVLPFKRKLTGKEIEELLKHWDYDPNRFDNDDLDTPSPVYDEYGNPTVETMDAFYEEEHGIGEETSLDELLVWSSGLRHEENIRVENVQA